MEIRTALILTLLLTLGGLATLQAQDNVEDTACADDLLAVEEVAMAYLTSGQTGDVDLLRGAFHESARLQSVKDGRYTEWSGQEFISWRRPGKRSEYEARVLSVDCAGTAAVAKVELVFSDRRYVDYLSLLEIDGRWWIVNKIFHTEREVF